MPEVLLSQSLLSRKSVALNTVLHFCKLFFSYLKVISSLTLCLLSHFVSAHADFDDCPEDSFTCSGGRCLPLSWRCNGQAECLNEGPGLSTDEQGCYEDVEATESTNYEITLTKEPKSSGMRTERNYDRDSEKHKTPFRNADSDLWALLKERKEEEAQVDQAQPQTQRVPAVIPTPIEWSCGGLLQTFYGTFSPPPVRGPALSCVWTLDPQDSRPLRLDLQQLVLGSGDIITVYNREKEKGDVIKIVSFKLRNTSNHFIQLNFSFKERI